MAVAALIISILALLAAGLSAWYARSQAHHQAEATRIERDRRHGERAPDFEAEIEDVNGDGGFYRLWVTLTSVEALDQISVELPSTCAFVFTPGIHGVADNRHAESYEGKIEPNGRACWRVELVHENYTEKQKLLVRSQEGADKWSRQVVVDVPYDVGATVF